MNKIKNLILVIFLVFSHAVLAQKTNIKEKPIDIITQTLYPQVGKIDPSDISYSKDLEDKYGVVFTFFKINNTSSGDANFGVELIDGEVQSEELEVGDYYTTSIFSKDGKYKITAKYLEFNQNKKTPQSGKTTCGLLSRFSYWIL